MFHVRFDPNIIDVCGYGLWTIYTQWTMLYTIGGILSIQALEQGCKMERKAFDIKSKVVYFEPTWNVLPRELRSSKE